MRRGTDAQTLKRERAQARKTELVAHTAALEVAAVRVAAAAREAAEARVASAAAPCAR